MAVGVVPVLTTLAGNSRVDSGIERLVVKLSVVAFTVPAVKLPEPSRLTMASTGSAAVGATFHLKASVPVDVTGDPVTVKSEDVAVNAPLFTEPGRVPGKVCPAAKVIWPLLLIFNPVSAAAAGATENRRFSVPEAEAVLLLTGSACQWKTSFCEVPAVLLNADATKPIGLEMVPADAVAFPELGRLSSPRMVAPPFTSSVAAGVVELMPIFAAVPLPVWNSTELVSALVLVQSGMKSAVPDPVTLAGGRTAGDVALPFAETAPPIGGAASTKAEGGNPPMVSASAAFIA